VLKDVTTINQALSSSSKVAADSLKLTSETIEKASAFNGNILEGFKTHTTHIEQTTEKFRTVGSEIGQMANTLSGASEHLLVEVKKSADAFSEQSRALVFDGDFYF
jgi:methyl-accepting chemotaxis protein